MKQIITDTNWRGVPCTMRYDGSLQPVCKGEVTKGGSIIEGGTAPHKESSTGYVTTDKGSYYVGTVNARWVEDFEPNAWAVMVRYKKKVVNMTTGKKEWDTWGQAGSYSIEHYGDDDAYLMAHGKARLLERYDSNNECYVKAVFEEDFKV